MVRIAWLCSPSNAYVVFAQALLDIVLDATALRLPRFVLRFVVVRVCVVIPCFARGLSRIALVVSAASLLL